MTCRASKRSPNKRQWNPGSFKPGFRFTSSGLRQLEITEAGILHDGVIGAGVFERLRDAGIGISIDDFGTGYSSLMHLKRLPFTELKVDRSFVRDLLIDEHDAAIVRSTIDLGQELGRRIVAEGVEDAGVLDRLAEFGCDYAQGYFISVPLERDELLKWLTSSLS